MRADGPILFPPLESALHRVALVTPWGRWTYGALADLSARIREDLGVRLDSGDACALVMGANLGSVAAFLAASSAHPVVLLSDTLELKEMRRQLDDSGTRLLVLPRSHGGDHATVTALDGWREVGERDELVYLARTDASTRSGPSWRLGDQPVLCQLTSGSTGPQRLAVRAVAGLALEVEAVVDQLALTHEDTILITSSLAHSYGLCGGLLASLAAGECVAVTTRVEDLSLLAHALRPTVIFGLGSTYAALMEAGDRSVMSRTRLALSAGASLPAGLWERFHRWCGLPIRQDYGTTEVGTIAVDTGESVAPETVGYPLRHITVRLAPPLHGHLRGEEQGEILVRSEAAARWYLERGRLIPCLDGDGWYPTGDAGWWDTEGRLLLGHRLRPPVLTELGAVDLDVVEQAARAMPGVEEAAAVPHRVEDGREIVRLIVVGRSLKVEAVRAWCVERLAPHEAPTVIERRDALPRSPAGKVLYRHLERPT